CEGLEKAHVILLLVSPDFIASDFCWSTEMARAMERHEAGTARVIPVLLRPVDNWQEAPFGKLQGLPPGGKAVTEHANRDVALRDVAAGVRTALEHELRRRVPGPASADAAPLRVVILIGHSLREPWPEAAEMAQASALELRDSGLAVELRVDQATTAHFEREARAGCDLFIYYGHGTEDGRLAFADGPRSFADLSQGDLGRFWQDLGAGFLFACYGDRFAVHAPCPWVAFAEPILTQAPKGFMEALVRALGELSLPAAVEAARQRCERAMSSSFTRVMRFSDRPLPELRTSPGVARLSRVSPALSNRFRVDFGSLGEEGHLDPDNKYFVGRRTDLESLLRLPAPYDDRPKQRVVWVHGDASMGKSALLRQLATYVRDFLFEDVEEQVCLLHLHCFKFTQPEEVVAALCGRCGELYEIEPAPASLEELFAALEGRHGTRGRHVWILDDLTYLSAGRPDSKEEAERLVRDLRDLANRRGLRWQLTVSSRRPGPKDIEDLRVGSLSGEEAQALARLVWGSNARDAPADVSEVGSGAAQLYRLLQSTGQLKRAMLLAVDRGMSYREYADSLNEDGSLDAMDSLEAARRTTAFEVRQLAALEAKHGFSYGAFLKVCYPVIARAAYFTREELEGWFGDRLVTSSVRTDVAYKNGLRYLVRLNFLLVENRDGHEVFTMPPNQRWPMRALSDPEEALPPEVPRRGARERLSLALERAGQGDWDAVGDLLLMEGDYKNDLDDVSAAAAVFFSMLMRAELERARGPEHEMAVLDELVRLHDEHRHLYSGHDSATAEPVARALFNKGFRLGALDRSAEALAVYDEVVSRYGQRQEPALAERVAKALVNKGFRLGALDRSAEALAVYDEVVSRYGQRQEPALAEQVAKALVNKGFRLGALDRSAEELAVYDEVVSRYGQRQEPALAEPVATALVNKGVSLGALDRSAEAIAVYDEVVSRYGQRQEPAIAEQVASALGSKGWREYELGRYDDSVVSSRAALERNPKATFARCNLALALLHLGEIEAAKDAYAEAAREIAAVEDLDRLALTDLDDAIARRPELGGADEIRAMLVERREALARRHSAAD
ncbi:MAG TPA: AAA family ATPase, partial [Thermoanaerobaculia bacterium]